MITQPHSFCPTPNLRNVCAASSIDSLDGGRGRDKSDRASSAFGLIKVSPWRREHYLDEKYLKIDTDGKTFFNDGSSSGTQRSCGKHCHASSWQADKLVQTGIGSKIVMGFHVPLTSDNMANARDGEHMKCRIFGLSNLVSSRSVGVSRIRGVVYSNLVLQMNKTDNRKANESVPSMFSFIRILSPCRAMMGLVSEQPHFPPIFQELSFD